MEINQFTGDLILVRGLPGSGKTTLSNIILMWPSSEKPDVISSDDFFVNENNEYIFDLLKTKEAINDCQNRCAQKMRIGTQRIVVANTFVEESEMEPYFEIAKMYNYRVHTIVVENRHGSKNVHGIPKEKIREMKKKFKIKL
jgi:hypothetical protein